MKDDVAMRVHSLCLLQLRFASLLNARQIMFTEQHSTKTFS